MRPPPSPAPSSGVPDAASTPAPALLDDLPKVTAGLLTRAERGCARRLALEHADQGGNRLGRARWAVAEALHEELRLAHLGLAPPDLARVVAPGHLAPEQQAVLLAALRWYDELFGGQAARVIAPDDEWSSDEPSVGVRLVARTGLCLEDARGERELRYLRLGDRRGVPPAVLEDPEVRIGILRRARWVRQGLRVTVADLLRGDAATTRVDDDAVAAARSWLGERLALLRARVRDPVPHISTECGWCPFVASCRAHRGA